MSEDMTERLEVLLRRLCTAVGWTEVMPEEDFQATVLAVRELSSQAPRGPLAKLLRSEGSNDSSRLLGSACKELRTSSIAVGRDYPARLASAMMSKVYADSTHIKIAPVVASDNSTALKLCAAYSFASVAMRTCAEVSPEPCNNFTFILYQRSVAYAIAAIELNEQVRGNRVGSAHPLHYMAAAKAATILASYYSMRHRRISLLGQAYLWWTRAIVQDNGSLPNQEDYLVAAQCAFNWARVPRNLTYKQNVFANYIRWNSRATARKMLTSGVEIQKI